MNFKSALETQYRARTVVRSGAPERMDEGKLNGAIVLTQLALLGLCAARVESDRLRGPLSIEGSIALVILTILAMWLAAKAIAWTIWHDVSSEK